MYDILAISMKLEKYPQKDIERVLLSQVDFTARDVNSMLFSAAFLKRMESYDQALNLYRQASSLDPYKHEPYIQVLKLARSLKDSESLQWAVLGILNTAWRLKDYAKYEKQAMVYANEEIKNLREAGKDREAEEFIREIREARTRDLEIELTWSGEGELDLSIEEPSGTVCSHENVITKSGGVYVHDGIGQNNDCFEKYSSRIADSGNYIIRIHHVDKNERIVGNRATLKIIEHRNSPQERTITRSVLIARTDSVLSHSFENGRNKK